MIEADLQKVFEEYARGT